MGVILEKRVGETPLQALQRYRESFPVPLGVSLTYAGRLDPMAEGKLLILIGDECKRKDEYDALDKEYEFEVLLGFSSDTGDVLGLPASCAGAEEYSVDKVKEVAHSLIGRHTLPYPAFSSKTVGGKPLFQYALEGRLDSIEIPTADVRIYKMEYMGKRIFAGDETVKNILEKINLLRVEVSSVRLGSDFRKREIYKRWRQLQSTAGEQYTVLKFKATVSSGTYIRTIAPLIAERLGACGIAHSIKRTRIGRYRPLTKRFGFWQSTLV
jgi:tRNA pseudouridine55 synthase